MGSTPTPGKPLGRPNRPRSGPPLKCTPCFFVDVCPAWETGDRTLDRMRKFGFIGQPSKAWKRRTICAVSLTAKLYVPPRNRIKHKGNGGREISISMSSTCRFLVSMVEMSIISSSLAPPRSLSTC